MLQTFYLPYGLSLDFVADMLGNGRIIEIKLKNISINPLKFIGVHYESGGPDTDIPSIIEKGKEAKFQISKKFGFYGVESVFVYQYGETGM